MGLKTLGVYSIPVPVVGSMLDGPVSLLRPGWKNTTGISTCTTWQGSGGRTSETVMITSSSWIPESSLSDLVTQTCFSLSDYKLELHYNNMKREDSLILIRSWKLLMHSSREHRVSSLQDSWYAHGHFWDYFLCSFHKIFLFSSVCLYHIQYPKTPVNTKRCPCKVTILVIPLSHMDLLHVVVPSGPWPFVHPHTFVTSWLNSGPCSFQSSYNHIYLLPGGCRSSPYSFTEHLIKAVFRTTTIVWGHTPTSLLIGLPVFPVISNQTFISHLSDMFCIVLSLLDHWRWRHYVPSKCQQLTT